MRAVGTVSAEHASIACPAHTAALGSKDRRAGVGVASVSTPEVTSSSFKGPSVQDSATNTYLTSDGNTFDRSKDVGEPRRS